MLRSLLFLITFIFPLHIMAGEFRDLTYATVDGRDLLLDLYLPEAVHAPPLVVWIHGGAWQSGSRKDPPGALVEAGYALASVDFRPSTEAVFPGQIHDIKAAIRYLRANANEYGYRPDRIAVWGMSSGGHLAALMATTNGVPELEGAVGEFTHEDSSVQAAIDFYGPANLLTILEQSTPHGLSVRVPALELLLGGSMDEAEVRESARLASPVHYVNAADPPMLIMHGVHDNQVPLNQSIELHQAYEANRLDSQLVLIPGAGHFDEIYYQGEYMEKVTDFLKCVLEDGE